MGRGDWKTWRRNGQLLSACVENEQTAVNTLFQHKDIHKFTWDSGGCGLRSIIDYFIVRKSLR